MTSDCPKDYQVLIVGAGVVGLCASVFLAQQGVTSMVIERRSSTSVHPRSRSVNLRTMELFRHIGIESQVFEAGRGIDESRGIYVGESLEQVIGPHPRRATKTTWPFETVAEQFGPAKGTFVTQDKLEPILLRAARERGVHVEFDTELVDFRQDTDHVTLRLRNRTNDVITSLSVDYVIAADGAKSTVCAQLKAKKVGRGTMGHMLNILFRADLAAFVENRCFSLVKIRSQNVNGLFTSINNADRWVFHLSYEPSRAAEYTKERCTQLVQAGLGMPDIKISIESILPWEPAVNVAESLEHGRVFLAGDAAHQMPPWAGQGANTGYADVHNLAWKIAAVLSRRASTNLLKTYDFERQPVGHYAAEASAAGADEMGVIQLDLWKPDVWKGLWKTLPLFSGLGYSYESPAICEESAWPLRGLTWKPWSAPSLLLSLDGRPGRRVPHIWVQHGSQRISSVDIVHKNFFMLVDEEGGSNWKESAESVSKELGTVIDVYSVGPMGDLRVDASIWRSAAGLADHGGLLVRPDDFVAKRWRRACENNVSELRCAMEQVLCL